MDAVVLHFSQGVERVAADDFGFGHEVGIPERRVEGFASSAGRMVAET